MKTRNIRETKRKFTFANYNILQFIHFTGTLMIMQKNAKLIPFPTVSEHHTVQPETIEDRHTISPLAANDPKVDVRVPGRRETTQQLPQPNT